MAVAINPHCPCPGLDCSCCFPGTTPKFLLATVSGVINGDRGVSCPAVNNQYVLTQDEDGACEWTYDGLIGNVCGDDGVTEIDIFVTLTSSEDGKCVLGGGMSLDGPDCTADWTSIEVSVPLDCSNLSGTITGDSNGCEGGCECLGSWSLNIEPL